MVSLVETEGGHRHRHGDLPALTLLVERGPQLLAEVEEVVFVAESAASIGGSRIFPIEIETVEAVSIHEICEQNRRFYEEGPV